MYAKNSQIIFGRKLPREIKLEFYLYYKNLFILKVFENIGQNEANTEEYSNVLKIRCTGIMKVLIYYAAY